MRQEQIKREHSRHDYQDEEDQEVRYVDKSNDGEQLTKELNEELEEIDRQLEQNALSRSEINRNLGRISIWLAREIELGLRAS